MRLPRASDTLAALLVGAVTWGAWPWWSGLVTPHLPALPGLLGLAAAYVLFRVTLSPLRATFAWAIAAGTGERGRRSAE